MDEPQIAAGSTTEPLHTMHEEFILEAVRLRLAYKDKIKLLIGFEGEWIRPSYGPLILELATNPNVDYFIGSVHHVHEIPIDYDAKMYKRAREVAGGTDERLFEDYFDLQFEMLNALKPKVVGHFDLIRLLSDEPDRDLSKLKGVWERVLRNLKLIVEQSGLMEINTSALRKGLGEPYPRKNICEVYLEMGGKLTMSDDSHGIVQVGTNFERAIGFLEDLGVGEVFTLEGSEGANAQGEIRGVSVKRIKESFRP